MNLENFYLLSHTKDQISLVQRDCDVSIKFPQKANLLLFKKSLEIWLIQTKIQHTFKLEKAIGKGGFGKIYAAYRFNSSRPNKIVSIKKIEKEKITDSKTYRYLMNEINALRIINHKNSVKLYSIYEEKNDIFIVTEMLSGGTLGRLLNHKMQFSSNFILNVAHSLLQVIQYFNKFNIVHRDIKPDNIMFKSNKNGQSKVKLIDYGLSANYKDFSTESLLYDKSGTAGYLAPELIGMDFLKKFYNEKVDVFSVGTILYEMVSGVNPFACKEY